MVVVDSSALIPLIKIGRLDLLRNVFAKILIPEPVWEEVVTEGKRLGKPIREFEEGVDKWYKLARYGKKIEFIDKNLEKNDFIVFSIAKDNNEVLLTNDASLYYYALSQNVKSFWLTTLLLYAVKKKKLDKTEAENILLEMVNTAGLHLRSDILSELLGIIKNL